MKCMYVFMYSLSTNLKFYILIHDMYNAIATQNLATLSTILKHAGLGHAGHNIRWAIIRLVPPKQYRLESSKNPHLSLLRRISNDFYGKGSLKTKAPYSAPMLSGLTHLRKLFVELLSIAFGVYNFCS